MSIRISNNSLTPPVEPSFASSTELSQLAPSQTTLVPNNDRLADEIARIARESGLGMAEPVPVAAALSIDNEITQVDDEIAQAWRPDCIFYVTTIPSAIGVICLIGVLINHYVPFID